jgi:S1-C subfamily serine protease
MVLLVIATLLVACAAFRPVEPTPTAPQTEAIVEEVLSRLATTSEQPAGAAAAREALIEAVLARVRAELNGTTPAVTTVALEEALKPDLETALVTLYRRANPAVVYIIVSDRSSGSGFVYDRQGHIVTNNHVVADGRSYEIVFAGGERRRGRLVGTDPDSDLAVLKVDDLPAAIDPLPIAETDDLVVGQFVVAIGNPFGNQGSMSLGIVSGLDRSLRSVRGGATGAYSLPKVIQTDAPINPGNSGGPLLTLDGRVVGVNSAIVSTTGVNSGVGFAIPAAAVRRIVPALITDGRYTYPYMGASFADEIGLAEQEAYGLSQIQGAYVLDVVAGGPAARAGLIAADPRTGRGGDLIIAIDDQPVQNFADLNSYLAFHTRVGQTVALTVLRQGRQLVVPLTLGARP